MSQSPTLEKQKLSQITWRGLRRSWRKRDREASSIRGRVRVILKTWLKNL